MVLQWKEAVAAAVEALKCLDGSLQNPAKQMGKSVEFFFLFFYLFLRRTDQWMETVGMDSVTGTCLHGSTLGSLDCTVTLTTDHCSSDSFFFSFFLAPTTTTTTAPTVTCSSQPPPPFTIFALFQDLRLSKANNQHQIFDWILVVI